MRFPEASVIGSKVTGFAVTTDRVVRFGEIQATFIWRV
jgi:hypothetical protein